ncbi:class II fructose-1,6-bisphosphate aldolase [Paenibacillus melissococcoides]|uniref:Class II fructose-1,6-bisphosphate aldolase n=1 Tax=Paenibacillus melissococcoides TaxID=2912268 RepID=A0ABN8UF88_9BACL|nr:MULTISPECIES: class II fructose-1,6-bisphosphate aldolase [Paenibacillus]MEB9896599.1 class II fructose-1,6-bisphosphate aldolase [Bacillus cereus]CAH8248319.1 class II fructose-1,6-bisphosphate aldolase [Paenibacillus melissococcoides]CAH8717838.1 class II fructose-1,6-bisphosphate aldolase [Paenibacillus melissococcoides]CAH8719286.1 class II fructose-1,6-bisphosphate aldolase [Paenibacillus melissococcoides]GIO77120.1 6-phospho-5-dehydro-2-deoxy-D-gluconate aldolase [Paenibacillus dendri
MTFVPMTEMLQRALKENYAVGQFNINGLLWVQAILQAAEEARSPVILAASDRLIEYLGGFAAIASMVKAVKEELEITVPVALHLDHGSSFSRCVQAIDAGFSSVMYDGSHLPIQDNIANTQKVTAYAHAHGVSVEAEVGSVGGMEDGLVGGIRYADLSECERLVREAGVDALAPALGSVHGKYHGEPVLGFKEMQAIAEAVRIPLVLHGASGIPLPQLKRAIDLGHAKVNYNTELVTAWAEAVRTVMEENPALCEPRAIMMPAKEALVAKVKEKINELGSAGKA